MKQDQTIKYSFYFGNSHIDALQPYFDYHAQFLDIQEGEIYGHIEHFYQHILSDDIAIR